MVEQSSTKVMQIIKRRSRPPHTKTEICDAEFVYTNRICLAVEDRRQTRCLSRGVLV